MNWRETIMALLLLATAVFLWQLLEDEAPETPIDANIEEAVPGYYLNDAELTRFNENGKLLYTIRAEKIEQDPRTDALTLANISIEYHEQAGWLIKADSAVLPASRDTINFSGNVIATQDASPNVSKSNIQFTSDSLIYNIKDQQLSTTDRISAQKGSQVISAVGMLLDMPNERVQLQSQVKIRFRP